MLSDGFDLEDLEARLYGQVFHVNADEVLPTLSSPVVSTVNIAVPLSLPDIAPQSTAETTTIKKGYKPRYYEPVIHTTSTTPNSGNDDQGFFIHKSGDTNLIYEKQTIPVEQRPTRSCLNNITVNQYTYSPLVVNQTPPPQPYKYFESWFRKSQCLQNTRDRRKAAKEMRQKRKAQRSSKRLPKQVILVSDESDCEVEIVRSDEPGKKNNNRKVETSKADLQEDDDPDAIVYIEPPPVPLVTIDSDEENDNGKVGDENQKADDKSLEKNIVTEPINTTKSPDLLFTPESTNDFIDHTGIETNSQHRFNFSLHGTDFCQTVNEFLRPANPDTCETESSCSTSDCTRDFNNSSKTAVFSEVDFPKEDLFSEQNLERFGTFITPKRVPMKRSGSEAAKEKQSKICKTQVSNAKVSDSSESENEHEFTNDKNPKRLPTLSSIPTEDTLNSDKSDIQGKSVEKKKYKTRKQLKRKESNNEEGQESGVSNVVTSDKIITEVLDNALDKAELSFKSDSEKQQMKLDTSEPKKKKKKARLTKKVRKSSQVDSQTHSVENETDQISEKYTNGNIENDSSLTSTFPSEDINKIESDIEKNRKRKSSKSSEGDSELEIDIKRDKSITKHDPTLSNINVETLIEPSIEISTSHENDPETSQCSTIAEFVSEYEIDQSITETYITTVTAPAVDVSQDPIFSPPLEVSVISDHCSDSDEFIVVDEDELIDVENIENSIPDSSESDRDFSDLTNVGVNIELANTVSAESSSEAQGTFYAHSEFTTKPNEFDLEVLWDKMSDDPEKWKISPRDRLGPAINMQRGPKCKRCRHIGHLTNNCPNKPGPSNCSLCGNPGHKEPRCPNRVCFQCGNPGKFSTIYCWKCAKHRNSVCCICQTAGHAVDKCPDAWRRYHLTTKSGPLEMLTGPQLKPRSKQWCSGCAQQGHLEHECNSYYYQREYPAVAPYIHDYQDLYKLCVDSQSTSIHKINPAHFSRRESTDHTDVLPGGMLNVNPPHNIFDADLLHNFVQESSFSQIPPLLGQANSYFAENTVINPFSILQNPGCPGASDPKPDAVRIYNHLKTKTHKIFRSSPVQNIQEFIRKDIKKLNQLKVKAKYLRKRNFIIHRKIMNLSLLQAKQGKRVSKEITEFYKKVNMFVFGKHKLHEGGRYLGLLKKFVENSETKTLSIKKRIALEKAYNYIFGGDIHNNVVYRKVLSVLIHKEESKAGS